MKSHACSPAQPLFAAAAFLMMTMSAFAQENPAPREVKKECQSVIAAVMVGKVACTAALCNTGASKGGFSGLLTQIANRGAAIDGASFSAGVGTQLATALSQTGCFTVVDAASLEETRKEMEALGRAAMPPPPVDFIIRSSVTSAEFILDESGLLGFKSVTAKSSLTIDTKLVSALSGVASDAGVYDSTIERKSSGVSIPFYKSKDDAAKRGTPFAEVTRDVVVQAAAGLAKRIMGQPQITSPAGTALQQVQPFQAAASAPQ